MDELFYYWGWDGVFKGGWGFGRVERVGTVELKYAL